MEVCVGNIFQTSLNSRLNIWLQKKKEVGVFMNDAWNYWILFSFVCYTVRHACKSIHHRWQKYLSINWALSLYKAFKYKHYQKLLQNVRKKHEGNNKRDPHHSCRLWPRWFNLTTQCPTWVTRGIKVCSTDFVRISRDNRASFTWGPAILRQLKKVTYCWVKG